MCIGAEECVKICPANVFEMVDGKSTAPRVAECTSCCACVDACPTKCIKHSACP
ncbi:MAG: 4Fe-4S ferredoxin [Thermoplasmata archaeon HGW-Thermoplasmata-2]|nr:MAG: 4Fe-4S ferredoxin [Thermoplasmata archaeon HGW-Thermoplasmata-2]